MFSNLFILLQFLRKVHDFEGSSWNEKSSRICESTLIFKKFIKLGNFSQIWGNSSNLTKVHQFFLKSQILKQNLQTWDIIYAFQKPNLKILNRKKENKRK